MVRSNTHHHQASYDNRALARACAAADKRAAASMSLQQPALSSKTYRLLLKAVGRAYRELFRELAPFTVLHIGTIGYRLYGRTTRLPTFALDDEFAATHSLASPSTLSHGKNPADSAATAAKRPSPAAIARSTGMAVRDVKHGILRLRAQIGALGREGSALALDLAIGTLCVRRQVCFFVFADSLDGDSRHQRYAEYADDGGSISTATTLTELLSLDVPQNPLGLLLEQKQQKQQQQQQYGGRAAGPPPSSSGGGGSGGGGGGGGNSATFKFGGVHGLQSQQPAAKLGTRPSDRIGAWFTPTAAALSTAAADFDKASKDSAHLRPAASSPPRERPVDCPIDMSRLASRLASVSELLGIAPTADQFPVSEEALERYQRGIAKADEDYMRMDPMHYQNAAAQAETAARATLTRRITIQAGGLIQQRTRDPPPRPLLPSPRKHARTKRLPSDRLPRPPSIISAACAHCQQHFIYKIDELCLVRLPALGEEPLKVAEFQLRQLRHARQTQDYVRSELYPALVRAFAEAENRAYMAASEHGSATQAGSVVSPADADRRAAMLWLMVRSRLRALVMRSIDALVQFFEDAAGSAGGPAWPVLEISPGSGEGALSFGPVLGDMREGVGEIFDCVAGSFDGAGTLFPPAGAADFVPERHAVEPQSTEVAEKRAALFRVLHSNDERLKEMAVQYEPAVLILVEGASEMVESMADVGRLHAGLKAAMQFSRREAQSTLTFMRVCFEAMHSWIAREARDAIEHIIDATKFDTRADLVMLKKDLYGMTKRLDKAFEHGRGLKDADTIQKIRNDMVPEQEARCRRVQLKLAFLCENGQLSSYFMHSYREAREILNAVSDQLSALRV